MSFKYYGSRKSGSIGWLLQRITGIFLIFAMVGHYIYMHYSPEIGHSYEQSVMRFSSAYWKMFYLTFITLGLWHGLNGIWSILRDFKMKHWVAVTLYGIIVISGIAFWVLGVITALSF
jgi:succinate dehydrogenase / fumarate reductase membrane anchor subunit